MDRGATLSSDGRYRYVLWRTWEPKRPSMTFVMLNPSTADADVDDPTIRRCVGFAKREGFGELVVLNLFSFRAADPADLLERHDAGLPLDGPEHDRRMAAALAEAHRPHVRVAAWGAHPLAKAVLHKLPTEMKFYCLGTTKDGSPRHPLYVRGDQPFVPFTLGHEGEVPS